MLTISRKITALTILALAAVSMWILVSLHVMHVHSASNIWMLNVGQGESVLLRDSSGHLILFDGGPDDSVLSQLGAVLSPWEKKIDLVILSHNHSDHIRGILSVIDRYAVAQVWLSGATAATGDYDALVERLRSKGISHREVFFDASACDAASCPHQDTVGDFGLQVFHPLRNVAGEQPQDQHDATVMVKATLGQTSILLTGDLNELHEQLLMEACERAPNCSLSATLMQVPHHGSSTGLLLSFERAVSPQAGLIPVGKDNKYGHPAPSVIERLRAANVRTYRTDTQGRIHAIINGQHLKIVTER